LQIVPPKELRAMVAGAGNPVQHRGTSDSYYLRHSRGQQQNTAVWPRLLLILGMKAAKVSRIMRDEDTILPGCELKLSSIIVAECARFQHRAHLNPAGAKQSYHTLVYTLIQVYRRDGH
jgi:hypothetical protein